MENKEIRFIDSSYNELFRIPDGGYITVKTRDGAVTDRKCKYIDDYHTQIGYNVFHICQFAELMERGGNIYRPKDTPDLKLERISQEEFEFTFAPKDKEQNRGCICYIRGYFDNSIDERFQSSAMIESSGNYKKYKTNDFSRELDNIINYFRFQADTPILKSRAQMRLASADTEHLVSDDNVFGYKVNTDNNVYYLRCDPRQGQYNVYCYAYNRELLGTYINLQFIEKHHTDIIRDKFFVGENGVTEVYYNPDAAAGGQLVYNDISFDLIKEAVQKGNNFKDFFSHLDSGCTQYLIDINTPEFKGNLDSFIRRKADFENCNAKTMKALKQAAGITPEKVRKDKNLER